MRLLLDTHAVVWWWTDDAKLSSRARSAIADDGNAVWVSAASAWELSTKARSGKWPEAVDAAERFDALVAQNGFESLPITTRHALLAGAYPLEHRDPFDRMLAAQCECEGLMLVSRDPALSSFGCDVLW